MQRNETILLIDPTCLTDENQIILANFFQRNKQNYYSATEEYHLDDVTFKLKYDICARNRKSEHERKSEDKIRIEGDRYEVIGDRILGSGVSGVVYTVEGTLIFKNDDTFEYKNRNKHQQSRNRRVVKIFSFEKISDALTDYENGKKGKLHSKEPVFVDKNNHILLFMRRAEGISFSKYVSSINSINNICQTIALIKAIITAYIKQVLEPKILHRDLRNQNLILDLTKPMRPRAKIIDFAFSRDRGETIEDKKQASIEINQLATVFIDRIWSHCESKDLPEHELEMIEQLLKHFEKMELQYRNEIKLPNEEREWKDQSNLLVELLSLLNDTEKHFQAFFYERAIEALKSKDLLEKCRSFLDTHKEYAEAISEHPEHTLSCLEEQNRSVKADFNFPNVLTKKSIQDGMPAWQRKKPQLK